jgi:hypothetical protein
MQISGEFDPGRCPMLVDVGTEVCETCGLKMCKLLELIKVAEEVNS